jgi:hypothetical protein
MDVTLNIANRANISEAHERANILKLFERWAKFSLRKKR